MAEDIIPQSPGICNFIFQKPGGFAVYIPWRSMLYFTQIKDFGEGPPMNETLELMMKRKSVRVFEEKPIGPEEKQAIF